VTRLRELGFVAVVHAALFLALWLTAIVLYAVVVEGSAPATWIAVDALLIAGALAFVHLQRHVLGFTSLGDHRGWKLAAIAVTSLVAVLACQLVVTDWNMVALDETNYLLTLREERIIRDGLLPFNIRWLVPMFGGRWNILPVEDAAAIKAINFGAFVLTAFGLILLLVRLRVPLWIALSAPVFLLGSYFGVYGASNRLVLDPANYALFVLMFHTLLRREHWPLFALVLLVDGLNAEKAVYFMPVFVFATLLREGPPWTKRDLIAVGKTCLYALAPTALYFLVLSQYLSSSRLEANLCFENLHVMSFTSLGGAMTENVRSNNMQMLWFPFGPFTLYALLGFALYSPRWMKPVALLVIPIFIQALIACDTARMLAYSFIVYLPFGFLYLGHAFRELPRLVAVPLFVLAIVLVLVEHFLFPAAKTFDWTLSNPNAIKMILSACELVVVGAIVFTHLTFYRESASTSLIGKSAGGSGSGRLP
jgi:hypothetical protein